MSKRRDYPQSLRLRITPAPPLMDLALFQPPQSVPGCQIASHFAQSNNSKARRPSSASPVSAFFQQNPPDAATAGNHHATPMTPSKQAQLGTPSTCANKIDPLRLGIAFDSPKTRLPETGEADPIEKGVLARDSVKANRRLDCPSRSPGTSHDKLTAPSIQCLQHLDAVMQAEFRRHGAFSNPDRPMWQTRWDEKTRRYSHFRSEATRSSQARTTPSVPDTTVYTVRGSPCSFVGHADRQGHDGFEKHMRSDTKKMGEKTRRQSRQSRPSSVWPYQEFANGADEVDRMPKPWIDWIDWGSDEEDATARAGGCRRWTWPRFEHADFNPVLKRTDPTTHGPPPAEAVVAAHNSAAAPVPADSKTGCPVTLIGPSPATSTNGCLPPRLLNWTLFPAAPRLQRHQKETLQRRQPDRVPSPSSNKKRQQDKNAEAEAVEPVPKRKRGRPVKAQSEPKGKKIKSKKIRSARKVGAADEGHNFLP